MRAPIAATASLLATAQARAEAKAQLLLRLRAQGYADLALMRAMEDAPREFFVDPAHVELALRDIAAPLPCGQTMEAPSKLARVISALAPRPDSRILEIGAGSGFSAKVLSLLARDVVSVECFERLALEATARLERLGVLNVTVIWADCCEIPPSLGLFDRILIHAAVEEAPPNIAAALGGGGVLIAPRLRATDGACELVRHVRSETEGLKEESLGPWRAQRLLRGAFSA